MATEDLKKAEDEEASEEADESDAAGTPEGDKKGAKAKVRVKADSNADENEKEDEASTDDEVKETGAEADDSDAAPVQLGYQRYVYAAYMAGAMLSGFLAAKIGHVGWYRLGQWKPEFGEPKDEILYPIAAVIGILIALYYWRKQSSRQYANEVAEELSKVTWPSRKEVTNSTTVVVLTTVFATLFFALMDRFWSYITDKIYSF